MTDKLGGKVALITGAGRGQGLAEARLFRSEGASVVLADIRFDDRASIEQEFADTGLVVDLDVGEPEQWQAVVEAARQRFGGIDVLINNAGIVAPSAAIIDLDLDLYQRVIRVNQIGPLLGIKFVAPSIIARGGGAIVNVSSVAGLGAIPGAAPYVSSKFATRGLTKVAAIELGPHKVRVNSIHPGGVDTPMLRESESAKRINYEPKNLPLGRIAQPEEVARLALFLACDDSSYCTGSEFVIDGGQTCALGTP
ncbi:MAG TPA: SDR family oxidoreductase [Acidimicrobiales bacterium]|nr:SDR family oxidoreductase [Acidimicrobiales bacterium]